MKKSLVVFAKNIVAIFVVLVIFSFIGTIILATISSPILLSENREKEEEISMLKKKVWEMYIQTPEYKKNQELYIKFLSR